MENKKKLGERKKYINNDMPRREILIKGKIAIRVREEKREGRIANINFQKRGMEKMGRAKGKTKFLEKTGIETEKKEVKKQQIIILEYSKT